MTQRAYILAEAGFPFYLDEHDPDADALFRAIPAHLNAAWSRAGTNHEASVLAGDKISDWMRDNWRTILPETSAKFPA